MTTMPGGVEIAADMVLVTSGRVGNTADLGLEAVGVDTDERGKIVVGDGFRTTVDGIYAAGDVIGIPALASASMEQARVAVCRAFGFAYKQTSPSSIPSAVYAIPEVSTVGTRRPARPPGAWTPWSAARRSPTTRAARSSGTARAC